VLIDNPSLVRCGIVSAPDGWEPDQYAPLGSDSGLLISLDGPHKDEWLHHLYVRFQELGRGVSAATKTGAEGYRYEERWFNDESKDLVRLRIVNGKGGLYVFLGTRDGGHSGAEGDFRSAVTYAIESTGQRRQSVAWEATICQVPAPRGLRTMGLRVGSVTTRDLRIESWGSVHMDDVPTWYPSMGIRGSDWAFWPVRVAGTASCYSWDEDGAEATASRLRYVVELLTLAFDCPMEVRVGPYEASIRVGGEEGLVVPGLRVPTVPDDHLWRESMSAPTAIPTWVAEVLDASDLDTQVRRALSAHYEGMLLKSDQPSMALIGFVASIETLAIPRKGLPRCPTCNMVTGSGQRFRDALATVLSRDEVELVGNAYDHRSKTAHAGHLHGSEDVLGMFPIPRLFSRDVARLGFEFGTVHLAAKASRELLLARVIPERRAPPS
jgi:hypothetical protein